MVKACPGVSLDTSVLGQVGTKIHCHHSNEIPDETALERVRMA
jgi:hypothetical protein